MIKKKLSIMLAIASKNSSKCQEVCLTQRISHLVAIGQSASSQVKFPTPPYKTLMIFGYKMQRTLVCSLP